MHTGHFLYLDYCTNQSWEFAIAYWWCEDPIGIALFINLIIVQFTTLYNKVHIS